MPLGQEAANPITSTSYYAVVEAAFVYRTGLSTHDASAFSSRKLRRLDSPIVTNSKEEKEHLAARLKSWASVYSI